MLKSKTLLQFSDKIRLIELLDYLNLYLDTGISSGEIAELWNENNTPMRFATNDTERIRIDNSGNVGIGTTSPDGTLHVHTGTAGTMTAHVSADDLVVEKDDHGGISILTPNNRTGASVQNHWLVHH